MRELVAQGLVTEAEEMLDQAGRGEDDRIVDVSDGSSGPRCVCLSVSLVCLSLLSVCLSVCPSVCLSVCEVHAEQWFP